jgi:hypothetical protein
MAAPAPAMATDTVGRFARMRAALFATPAPALTYATGLRIVLAFGLAAFAFAGASDLLAYELGRTLHMGGSVTSRPELLDAGWHAATGFVMVLPARNLRLCLFGPVLATEIDIDHLYGSFLPTEVGRPAHNVLFLLLVVAFLAWVAGRTGALL